MYILENDSIVEQGEWVKPLEDDVISVNRE